jgi:hypothetical protein
MKIGEGKLMEMLELGRREAIAAVSGQAVEMPQMEAPQAEAPQVEAPSSFDATAAAYANAPSMDMGPGLDR